LSRAISKIYRNNRVQVDFFEEFEGKGIRATCNTSSIQIGSGKWVGAAHSQDGGTHVYVSINEELAGYFSIEKPLREGLAHELDRLGKAYEIHLLSGDNASEKERFAPYFPVENMSFNQSPEDKMRAIEQLKLTGACAMVGDGLNDAGALKAADFGIAVVDDLYAFSPACDAIMHAGALSRLDNVLSFAKQAMHTVRWSFVISFVYNVAGLSFAVQGMLTPLVAAILMPLSSVTVVVFTISRSHWQASKLGLTGSVANTDKSQI
jgi:Cu+-exporting ATPase